MDKKKKILLVCCVVFVLLGFLIMFFDRIPKNVVPDIVSEDRKMPDANAITQEITGDISVEQDFINTTDNITQLAVVFTRLYDADAVVVIELDDGGSVLLQKAVKCSDVKDQHRMFVETEEPLKDVVNKELTLRIYSQNASDTGLALMMQANDDSTFRFGNTEMKGTICFSISGK